MNHNYEQEKLKTIKKINYTKGSTMKTSTSVVLTAIALFLVFGTRTAYAAGTPAGTVIKNAASMTYKDLSGNNFPTLYSDTVSVTVEQVAGVTLTPTGSLQYSSDSMYVYFPHTVTNTGNGTDSYTITSADSASWSPTILFDANGNGVLDGGENTVVSNITNLAADAEYKVIIRLFVPYGTTSGKLDTIRTAVTSAFDNSIDPIASAWVRDSIRTRTADVSLTKTNDNADPVPGQVITYTINYSNTGTGTAQNATLTDTLDANVTYNNDAVINNGGGSVALLPSPNRIVWSNIGNGGSIYGGATGQLTFSVTVNAGVAAGTTISNRAVLVYTDSISGRTETPPGGPTTSIVGASGEWNLRVEVAGGSTFDQKSKTDSVNVSQSIFYRLRLTNLGNRTDTASFAISSTIPLSWTLFEDVDSSGTFNTGDIAYSGNTGGIVSGGRKYFLAYDTVAQSVQDRRLDSALFVATSITLTAKDTGYTYTRIKAPVMTLTKSVTSLSGRNRPGDTLVYTITYTNAGSGTANQIVISDVSPSSTTYISNSVEIKNSANSNTFTAKTDTGDADEVEVTSGTITVNLGSVGPRLMGDATYTGQIRFKVRIN
jgi:uncharacterized repeat protein (TIGR01451 family)